MHRCVAMALVLSLCAPAQVWAVQPADSGSESAEARARVLYEQGSTLYSASDYNGAIEKFTAALHESNRVEGSSAVRGALLQNLARTHTRAYSIDNDVTHLRMAIDIYTRFLDEAASEGYGEAEVVEVRTRKAEVEAMLSERDAAEAGAPPADDTTTETAGASTRDESSVDSTSDADGSSAGDRRGATGSGAKVLIGTGAAAIVVGGVGIGVGAVFGPRARKQVDDVDDPPEREQDFVDNEKQKGRVWMITGGVLAAAGVGLLIAGVVKRKRSAGEPTVAWSPLVDPTRGAAGVSLQGAF